MSIINGKNIFIAVRNDEGSYYPIACDSSCTIKMDRPTIGITGPGDGLWRRIIPGGRITASINGNGLINYQKNMSLFEIQNLLISGTRVAMICEIPDPKGGSVAYEMTGFMTSCELTGAIRAAGSFTYSIDVDGAINLNSTIEKDPAEIGIQNLLLVDGSTGDTLDIGDGFNLII